MPENLVSRDGFSRPVPRQPAHLHTQTESGAYLRDSSRVPRRHPFMKPLYAIGSVPSLSGHANAYRWRSLPKVRRHRASKPQGSSVRVLPWQITMDQLIFATLSHTHYWYEVGMLKVPCSNTRCSNSSIMGPEGSYLFSITWSFFGTGTCFFKSGTWLVLRPKRELQQHSEGLDAFRFFFKLFKCMLEDRERWDCNRGTKVVK